MTKKDDITHAKWKAKKLGVTRTGVKKHINKNIGLKASQEIVDEIIIREPAMDYLSFDKNLDIIARHVKGKGKKTITKNDLTEIFSAQLHK